MIYAKSLLASVEELTSSTGISALEQKYSSPYSKCISYEAMCSLYMARRYLYVRAKINVLCDT